jgi:hypothetical protein
MIWPWQTDEPLRNWFSQWPSFHEKCEIGNMQMFRIAKRSMPPSTARMPTLADYPEHHKELHRKGLTDCVCICSGFNNTGKK